MTKHASINRRALLLSTGALSLAPFATAYAGEEAPLAPEQLDISPNGHFAHDNALFGELFPVTGYYYPNTEVQVGTFRLDIFHIGSAKDLIAFEENGQTQPYYAPFMFVFEDQSSTLVQGDLGSYRGNSPRVFPDRYRITRDTLKFTGFDRQVGRVAFTGRFDRGFLVHQLPPPEAPQVTGSLTVNGKTFRDLSFRYWEGD